MKCYVFKLGQNKIYPNVDTSDFFMLDSLVKTLRHLPILLAHFSYSEVIKLLIRSVFSNRYFYFVRKEGRIVSRGQLSTGFCQYYSVNKEDVVIGSIWTDPGCRGQGLASISMQAAINFMIEKGLSTFYIDTQETNTGMLKSIAKIGFGPSIKTFDL